MVNHIGRLVGYCGILAIMIGGCAAPLPHTEIAWQASVPLGVEQATEGQGLLVYFHASWCTICKRLERDTLLDPEIQKLLENFVPVRIDVDQQPNTAAHYQIDSVPAIMIIDAHGAAKAQATGFLSVPTLKKYLQAGMEQPETVSP